MSQPLQNIRTASLLMAVLSILTAGVVLVGAWIVADLAGQRPIQQDVDAIITKVFTFVIGWSLFTAAGFLYIFWAARRYAKGTTVRQDS